VDWLTNPEIWLAFLTLTVLEVVLGVDNVIFISILASKLPKEEQDRARVVGLSLAAVTRILFLLSIAWIMALKKPLFALLGHEVTGKDLVLMAGGLFLIYKSVKEIHERLEGEPGHAVKRVAPSFASVIAQVLLLDIVFSIDSVITAVGLTPHVPVMVAAILASVGGHAPRFQGHLRLCEPPPHGEDAGPKLPPPHRLHPGGRGHGGPHPQGVRLLRHGL
jgi:predicted tellurium resistance membrane protein TerC